MILPENSEKLWTHLNIYNKDRHDLRQIIASLSLLVILLVFWSLKLTGIGVAGEAFCGKEEHDHAAGCFDEQGNQIEAFKDEATENGFVYEAQEVVNCIRAGKIESDIVPHALTIACAKVFDLLMAEK